MSDIAEQNSLILIIDDSVNFIRLLSGMLKDQGQILFATSGEAGLQLARQRQPDLILLDVEMPGMDGYDVCRIIKSDVDAQRCAVMFVTAHTSPESEIEALEAGAVDFITKPLNLSVVRARVQTHLRMQRHSAALAQLVNQDGLTGLYNRRYFDELLEKEFQRHRRQKMPLGVAFIDIDHFKAYNDGYGHLEGDRCLKQVASTLRAITRRPGEIVARYGGEEFVAILPYTTAEEAQKYGERVCTHIAQLAIAHQFSPTQPGVTISVGVTSRVPQDSDSARQLTKAADQALYQAKGAGRNCTRVVLQS